MPKCSFLGVATPFREHCELKTEIGRETKVCERETLSLWREEGKEA